MRINRFLFHVAAELTLPGIKREISLSECGAKTFAFAISMIYVIHVYHKRAAWVILSPVAHGHAYVLRVSCTPSTAMPPSPTAAAQRFTEPERTSPAAKMPGRLVSSGPGARPASF